MKWQRLGRVVLAGPWTLAAAFVVMAAMAVWMPGGPAQVDNLIVPLVLFPLIWVVLFLMAYLDPSIRRAATISIALVIANMALLGWHWFLR